MQKEYWDKRWQDQQTGWDVGKVSTPLKDYFDQITDKNLRILIPGCGNAYEAEYLWEQGFQNTYIVEISELAVESFLKRYPKFPKDHVFISDFFLLNEQFDLIIEQTFFCAIDPKMREAYAKKSAELLKPGGKLVGLLFNRDFEGGPPFGGHKEEYLKTFSPYFKITTMDTAYNSIEPRKGTELFINLSKI
jgi:SAM-dependent methyltransferase